MRENAVSVGIGLRHRGGAKRAASARAILNDDGLTQFGRETIEHEAGHHIGRAACAEWNSGFDQSRWPGIGLGRVSPNTQKNTDAGQKPWPSGGLVHSITPVASPAARGSVCAGYPSDARVIPPSVFRPHEARTTTHWTRQAHPA